VVIARPVVDEIQRAFVDGFDPIRRGRDWFKYKFQRHCLSFGVQFKRSNRAPIDILNVANS